MACSSLPIGGKRCCCRCDYLPSHPPPHCCRTGPWNLLSHSQERSGCVALGNVTHDLGGFGLVRLNHSSPFVPSRGMLVGAPMQFLWWDSQRWSQSQNQDMRWTCSPLSLRAEEGERVQPGRRACVGGALRTVTFGEGQNQLWATWEEAVQRTHAHPPPSFFHLLPTPRATPWRAAWLPRGQTPLGHL